VDKKGYTLCLGGDKGYVFIVPPDEWELLLTQSAEKEKGVSLQTEVPVGGDPTTLSNTLEPWTLS
jgi:hypothetical protein